LWFCSYVPELDHAVCAAAGDDFVFVCVHECGVCDRANTKRLWFLGTALFFFRYFVCFKCCFERFVNWQSR
jgi:hypothetical protein